LETKIQQQKTTTTHTGWWWPPRQTCKCPCGHSVAWSYYPHVSGWTGINHITTPHDTSERRSRFSTNTISFVTPSLTSFLPFRYHVCSSTSGTCLPNIVSDTIICPSNWRPCLPPPPPPYSCSFTLKRFSKYRSNMFIILRNVKGSTPVTQRRAEAVWCLTPYVHWTLTAARYSVEAVHISRPQDSTIRYDTQYMQYELLILRIGKHDPSSHLPIKNGSTRFPSFLLWNAGPTKGRAAALLSFTNIIADHSSTISQCNDVQWSLSALHGINQHNDSTLLNRYTISCSGCKWFRQRFK
jgi:hypothetical protein